MHAKSKTTVGISRNFLHIFLTPKYNLGTKKAKKTAQEPPQKGFRSENAMKKDEGGSFNLSTTRYIVEHCIAEI